MTVNVMEDTVLEPGTIVRCNLLDGRDVEGEVTAFDINKKALLIVSSPPEGSAQKHKDIHLLNMRCLSKLDVIREPMETQKLPTITQQDCQKLTKRIRDKVRDKKALVSSIGIGVTPEAQSLFNSIRKTIEDVRWEGKRIVVMNDVFIDEPYTEKNISHKGRQAGLEHIRKIVRKHYDDKMNTSTHSIS